MLAQTNTLTIRTPEGISFNLLLAGPVSRFLAWLVDAAIVSALSQAAGMIFGFLGLLSRDLAMAATVLAYFAIGIGYAIALEWLWRGQTLGKRLLRLRVMDEQGLKLTFSQIVVRNLLRVVDGLPGLYLVGGLACLVSRRAQRLGDFAANTIVVRHPKIDQPDLSQLLSDKYNSFREHPHLEARLRRQTTPQEAGLALRALLRRDELDPQARVDLFRQIADHFRTKVAFPEETVGGLSDEKYVRNVVGALFRSGPGER
jgi:uncharacterized RDD family membrane protein YckC